MNSANLVIYSIMYNTDSITEGLCLNEGRLWIVQTPSGQQVGVEFELTDGEQSLCG